MKYLGDEVLTDIAVITVAYRNCKIYFLPYSVINVLNRICSRVKSAKMGHVLVTYNTIK